MDLIGLKFNRLTVKSKHPDRSSSGKVQWVCVCDCGNETITYTSSLKGGNTKSCGCLRSDSSRLNGKARATHGMTSSSEYKAWQSMRERCYREQNENFPHYGGRGITVCDEWKDSFENFYRDMGTKSHPGLSLDRKDTNADYTPGNCRWADTQTQNSNKRTNRLYLWQGEQLTLAEIARRTGVAYNTLISRIDRMDRSLEDAVAWKRYSHSNKGN